MPENEFPMPPAGSDVYRKDNNRYLCDPYGHSRQANNCKSLIMSKNIFTTPSLLETGFCFITFTISKNYLVF